MKSIYTTSLKTSPSEHHQNYEHNYNPPCLQISESYKDILYNHLIDIQNLSVNEKQNCKLNESKVQKQQSKKSRLSQIMLLSQFQPDLGSLGQFFKQKSSNRLIYTNKKKRHEMVNEENVLKKKIMEKNNEQQILRSFQTSAYEKKLASRVVVQKLFHNIFNTPVQEFVTTNNVRQPKKSELINISTLESLLQVSQKNHTILDKTRRFHTNQSQFSETSQKTEKRLKTKRNQGKLVYITFDAQTKAKYLKELKSKYWDLRKIQIPHEHKEFSLLIQAQNELDKYLKHLAYNTSFASRSSSILNSARNSLLNSKIMSAAKPVNVQQKMQQVSQHFRTSKLKSVIFTQTIAKVTDEEVFFKKMQFKDFEMGLYMIQYVKLQKIKVIRLQNIKIENSLLFLFIDVLCKFAPQINPLQQVSICSISIENIQKFGQKISLLLQEIPIKKLCLNYTDIGSRQFTRISVGMADNQVLESVEMRNNRIDFLATKSLDSLMRICPNIKTMDLRNNEIAAMYNLKGKDQRIIF